MSEPRRHALRTDVCATVSRCGIRAARHTKAIAEVCKRQGCIEVTPAGDPIVGLTEGVTCPACLDAIRKEIARLQAALAPTKRPEIEGCGDTSCRCHPPSGVATNGGCRCDEHRVHAALAAWRRYAMDLEARVP
jgi:hypothetical protein